MVRSPRSRGKGNRRYPGRPGGTRKHRRVGNWAGRCQHMVSLDEIPSPQHEGLWLGGDWRRRSKKHRAEDVAYLLDQELGRLGIPYSMTLEMRLVGRGFLVIVAESDASRVAAVIARLEG